MSAYPESAEWLEADGLGGFASGTVGLTRTRRYHALLLAAKTPPTGRFVLVNGFDAWVETPTGRYAISSQLYDPGVVHPDGQQRIESFELVPWPRWVFRLDDDTRIEQEVFVPKGTPTTVLRWRRINGPADSMLVVRPLFSGRDYHSLHHENGAFRFEPELINGAHVWRPYDGVPAIVVHSNGEYVHEPMWYRNFRYPQEIERGLDASEDLGSPGVFRWQLDRGPAVWILHADGVATPQQKLPQSTTQSRTPQQLADRLRAAELNRRTAFDSPLHRAADAYLVRRGAGQTVIAGYPWFTDWGRDTFIALRGLCLATARLDDAREILLDWAGTISQGMLPNRFPDHGDQPEFNSVDASLWYIVAVDDYLRTVEACGGKIKATVRKSLHEAIDQILTGYSRGTRYGIRMDTDCLLAAGEPGVQLTWMDVKLGDWVVVPRIGKPVEVQALWLNGLRAGERIDPKWGRLFEQGMRSFAERFWNEERQCLLDVVDVDHRSGVNDPTLRPNQILAVGGLPNSILGGQRAKAVVDAVETHLLTPVGLRSLARGEAGYRPCYQGGVYDRDSAYHQGTVWPWLLGPFVEAWTRVRGQTDTARREARQRFVEPLLDRRFEAGLGHVAEIADAEPPHPFRGCPFQAWSLGELLRLVEVVLKERPGAGSENAANMPATASDGAPLVEAM